MMSVGSVGAMPVEKISLCTFADEELLALLDRMDAPWRLAVCRSLRALQRAQDGTQNNPKLKGCVKVHAARYHASNVHGQQERLLDALEQKCSLYDVQGLTLACLYRDFESANLGPVLSLTPNLRTLSLKNTQLPRDSFADILGLLTALHTLDLEGNTRFMRHDNLVLPTALKKLNLGYCGVTDYNIRVLMRSVGACNLTNLNLWGNLLDRTTVLPELLSRLTGLLSCELSMTGLKGDYLVSIMSTLGTMCTDLQVLGLAGLQVADPRKAAFPKRLSKTQLEHRNADNARYFEELKRFTGLHELNLHGFWVGDVHANKLAEALGVMPQLKSLDLSGSGIEWEGAELIATALAVLPLLESVTMRDVEIEANGARAIRDAVAGRTQLVELTLTGQNFHY